MITHTVMEGDHFFATSTMTDSMYGIVHSLVGDRHLTNTSHGASRFMIRQMVAFYHQALVKREIDYSGTVIVLYMRSTE